ncbi:MAG: hypothetical protein OEM38_04935 [Gammaproteobacteria bacterium]|nr:hypothetical protein [Gammaproteobacteria bacterium]
MNKNLSELLLNLMNKDAELRKKALGDGSLYDGYNEEIEKVHIENAEKLNEIVSEYGWPGKSLVGTDGADAAIVIAQNSISKPALQKKFLEFVKIAVVENEALPIHEACLEDRILFNQGKPQKYGMLFDWSEKGEFLTNVDDIELANERRMTLDIISIEEATRLHLNKIDTEGGGPPLDFHEHKRKELEWAKKVGWR